MMAGKVTIDLDWYTILVEKYASVCAVERMIQQGGYVSTGDIQAILGIEKENGNEVV